MDPGYPGNPGRPRQNLPNVARARGTHEPPRNLVLSDGTCSDALNSCPIQASKTISAAVSMVSSEGFRCVCATLPG